MVRPVIGISFDHDNDQSRYQLNYNYVHAILAAGGQPLPLPFHDPLDDGLPPWIDGLLLTGGNDADPAAWGESWHPAAQPVDPARERHERRLLRQAQQQNLPVLGICFGAQLMNIVRGGSLFQHLPDIAGRMEHRKDDTGSRRHPVAVAQGSILERICGPGELVVNTFHHQGLNHIGQGLIVSATAPDGTIEAIEDPTRPFWLGVQWHPERQRDEPRHAALFQSLVDAARRTPVAVKPAPAPIPAAVEIRT